MKKLSFKDCSLKKTLLLWHCCENPLFEHSFKRVYVEELLQISNTSYSNRLNHDCLKVIFFSFTWCISIHVELGFFLFDHVHVFALAGIYELQISISKSNFNQGRKKRCCILSRFILLHTTLNLIPTHQKSFRAE